MSRAVLHALQLPIEARAQGIDAERRDTPFHAWRAHTQRYRRDALARFAGQRIDQRRCWRQDRHRLEQTAALL